VRWLTWLIDTAGHAARTKCVVVVDTLHLTHCLRPGILSWADVGDIDRRLAAIGGRLLLLDAEDETVRQRTVAARFQTEFIQGFALGRFGHTERDLVAHFQRERDRFRTMYANSVLPKLRVAAETPVERIADAALDFWLEPRR
jgi:hypothetical protein